MYLLSHDRLPPITSIHALSVMIGINPGIVWSFVYRTHKHYRSFNIPKGKSSRTISAPRIGLKIIQKWLSFHLARVFLVPQHVYGFVPGKSHLEAAYVHNQAEWALSVDIRDFFPSTPASSIIQAFSSLGYSVEASCLLSALTCFKGFLAQGAPTSPVLSNICFRTLDNDLLAIASRHSCVLSRYADDITFSGQGRFPEALRHELRQLFAQSVWRLADDKERLQPMKGRIKIHGLLVKDGQVRLTKGYRNKVRAYDHILSTRGSGVVDAAFLKGHVSYARHVTKQIRALSFSVDKAET